MLNVINATMNKYVLVATAIYRIYIFYISGFDSLARNIVAKSPFSLPKVHTPRIRVAHYYSRSKVFGGDMAKSETEPHICVPNRVAFVDLMLPERL